MPSVWNGPAMKRKTVVKYVITRFILAMTFARCVSVRRHIVPRPLRKGIIVMHVRQKRASSSARSACRPFQARFAGSATSSAPDLIAKT